MSLYRVMIHHNMRTVTLKLLMVEKNEIIFVPTGSICSTFSDRHLPAEVSISNLPTMVIPYVTPVIQCQTVFVWTSNKSAEAGKGARDRSSRFKMA